MPPYNIYIKELHYWFYFEVAKFLNYEGQITLTSITDATIIYFDLSKQTTCLSSR